MIARTKRQKAIVEINKSLPLITHVQQEWAFKNVLTHVAVRNKGGRITCLDCGHSWKSPFTTQGWQDQVMGGKCPNCNQELKVESTQKRNFSEDKYIHLIHVHKGYQVIRVFQIAGRYRSGRKRKTFAWEQSRIYMDAKSNYEVIGYSRQSNWYGGRWFGDFSLKQPKSIADHVDLTATIYPRIKVLPEIKRNGFKNDFHSIRPFVFFKMILTKPKAETLLKTGQYRFLQHCIGERDYELIERFWNPIKTCIKNNYKVGDVDMWFDYLKLCELFNRDIQNKKYACPVNLHKEHNKYVEKDRKRRLALEVKEMKTTLKKDQRVYVTEKKRFFDLEFNEGNITIKVIKSVMEVMDLGDRFKHCMYSLKYHRKKYSLLFVAHVDNEPVETVEYDLKIFKVLQSRGRFNHETEYHSKIMAIMDKHHNDIKKLVLTKTKKK